MSARNPRFYSLVFFGPKKLPRLSRNGPHDARNFKNTKITTETFTAEPPVSDQSKCQDFSDYLAVTALQVQQISRFDSGTQKIVNTYFRVSLSCSDQSQKSSGHASKPQKQGVSI